jgi:choline dehydrogenase-like flavoprotein
VVGAVYPERTNPWEGGILTAVVDEFQNLDSHGHGAKIEAMTMIPSWFLPFTPWVSGLDSKLFAAKMAYTGCHVILVRDRDTGRVYPDAVDGKCRVEYTPSAFDKRHALEGVIASAKMAYVQGAKEIFVTNSRLPTFVREDHDPPDPSADDDDDDDDDENDRDNDEGTNNPKFQAWLSEIRSQGLNLPETAWASAHQMGTCRMGTTQRNSVVDPRGKVWGVAEGLYVADASVFPSASGVNPMVTNMAISDWISRGIAKGLSRGKTATL